MTSGSRATPKWPFPGSFDRGEVSVSESGESSIRELLRDHLSETESDRFISRLEYLFAASFQCLQDICFRDDAFQFSAGGSHQKHGLYPLPEQQAKGLHSITIRRDSHDFAYSDVRHGSPRPLSRRNASKRP